MPVFVGIETVLVGDVVCVVEAVTVAVWVTAEDPDAVIDPVTVMVPDLDLVLCAVPEPVPVVDAVPVLVVVAAADLEAVGVLLAVTVAVTRGEPDPERVLDTVGAADPVDVMVEGLD